MTNLICPVVSTEQEEDFRKVIEHVFASGSGADTVFVLGTTGEFYKLSLSAKKDLVDIAVDEVTKQNKAVSEWIPSLKLAVGVTGSNLDETIELAQHSEERGVEYAVLLPVYINRKTNGDFTRRGVTAKVRDVVDNTSNLDWILYNNPYMTGDKNIRTATWKKLAVDKRICAIKDSSGDAKRVRNYQKAADSNAKVYVGDEGLGLSMPYPDGVVAGSSNVLPVAWSRATKRNFDEDISGGYVADELIKFKEAYAQNPIGAFKYLLARLGVISSDKMFDSQLELSLEQKKGLDQLMSNKNFKDLYVWRH